LARVGHDRKGPPIRTIRNTHLENAAARARLAPRAKLYWRVLEAGLHLGYRRAEFGDGSWTARRLLGGGKYAERGLGLADDLQDADGVTVLTYSDAQEKARAWWKAAECAELGLVPFGPYTVKKALHAYFTDRGRRCSEGGARDRAAARARILAALGDVELKAITAKRIRDWLTGLATAPKLARSSGIAKKVRKNRPVDPKDADAVRSRRATANQTLAVLKAALNHAFHNGLIANDEAWRKVRSLREPDATVVYFLSDDECRRLVNACAGAFRNVVRGALVTGCRYGELTRMRSGDFNAEAGTITVRGSKSRKPRHVLLTDEGRALFSELTGGHAGQDLIFMRHDGKRWRASHQRRPLIEACRRANIEPAATFHILRHTYASALAMRGGPMDFIAAQLGHIDSRTTAKRYAHLSPPLALGIVEIGNMTALRRA